MDDFWKIAAAVLIASILCLTVSKLEKSIALLIPVAVCCMAAAAISVFLLPVKELLQQLEAMANLHGGSLGVLMKCVGITLVSEAASSICSDAGFGSMGKMLQMTAGVLIMSLSIPLIQTVLNLIQEILGSV